MTERFEELAAEYDRLTMTLPTRLAAAKAEKDAEAAAAEMRNMHNDVEAARGLLNDMGVEARGFDSDIKRTYTDRIKKYRAALSDLASKLSNAQATTSRKTLLSGVEVEMSDAGAGHRSRLLETSERMAGTTDRLADARRTIEETQDVAVGITSELARNRDTIESAHRKVKDTRSALGNARRILGRMTRREKWLKCMRFGLIGEYAAAL